MKKILGLILSVVMICSVLTGCMNEQEKIDIQNDEKTVKTIMSEVKKILKVSELHTELKSYAVNNNYSCYVDEQNKGLDKNSDKATNPYSDTDSKNNYWSIEGCNNGEKGKTSYLSGEMYGVTITLIPTKDDRGRSKYMLRDAVINYGLKNAKTIDDRKIPESQSVNKKYDSLSASTEFYNRLTRAVGGEFYIKSDKYRNSEFTIFVLMKDNWEDTYVYGDFNGQYIEMQKKK